MQAAAGEAALHDAQEALAVRKRRLLVTVGARLQRVISAQAGIQLRCLSAIHRFAARNRARMSKSLLPTSRDTSPESEDLRGTERPHSFSRQGQPLGAPLMRRYFNARAATPYRCFRSRARVALRRIRPGHSSPGGRELGPLRLVRLSSAPSASGRPFRSVRAHLRHRIPRPESRRSAARVLTNEGWEEFNAGARGGDKAARRMRISDVSGKIKRDRRGRSVPATRMSNVCQKHNFDLNRDKPHELNDKPSGLPFTHCKKRTVKHGNQQKRRRPICQRAGGMVHRRSADRCTFPGPRTRARSGRHRHVRAGCPHRMAHAPTRANHNRDFGARLGAAMGRACARNPIR